MRFTYVRELARLYREFYSAPDFASLTRISLVLESAYRPIFAEAGSQLLEAGLVSAKPTRAFRKYIDSATTLRQSEDPDFFLLVRKQLTTALNTAIYRRLDEDELEAINLANPSLLPPS